MPTSGIPKSEALFQVIAGKNPEAAGIDRNGFVQAEFRGKIGDRPRPQNPGMPRAPGAIFLEIFALPPVGIVDAAMQHQFAGAPLDLRQRNFPSSEIGLWLSCLQRTGSRSRNRLR